MVGYRAGQGRAGNGMVWLGMAWHRMGWYGVAWCGCSQQALVKIPVSSPHYMVPDLSKEIPVPEAP